MEFRWTKLLRRGVAAALALILTIPPVLAEDSGPEVPEDYRAPFWDVADNNWFYPYVAVLNSQGVVDGFDDGGFHPGDAVTWGQALLMVQKAAGLTDQMPKEGEHWAGGYARHALSHGWITERQSLSLDASITRQEIARLTARVLGLDAEQGGSPYADVSDGEVTALYKAGVMTGSRSADGQTVFYPKQALKRSEMCVVVWQVMKKSTRIFFGGKVIDALPGVPVNGWREELFQKDEDGFMKYDAPDGKTSLGIDISSFQGNVNWRKVKRDGIEFAIIRAGGRYYVSGTIFEDTKFRENIKGAQDVGLETGVYFFSQAISVEEAVEEAEYILELLEDYDVDGPVVFDWEVPSVDARTSGLDRETLAAAALAFCQRVEEEGYQPMVYVNPDLAYNRHDMSVLAEYPTWLAYYGDVPEYYYDFEMWQYTEQGAVNGIEGPVDLNIRRE